MARNTMWWEDVWKTRASCRFDSTAMNIESERKLKAEKPPITNGKRKEKATQRSLIPLEHTNTQNTAESPLETRSQLHPLRRTANKHTNKKQNKRQFFVLFVF